jgi:Mn2+/Fe2+ NRAMP family transporter
MAWFFFAWRTGFHPLLAIRDTFIPSVPTGGITADLVFMVIALVGTTVAPWQLFFQQSAIADKRLRFKDLEMERRDTFLGAIFTVLVAGAMISVGAALRRQGISYDDPAQMAEALGATAGPIVRTGILLLMINAAVLGTTAISLSSAWAFAEVMNWPHSLDTPFSKAYGFYAVYIGAVAVAAGIVLIPGAPLQIIILGVQVLAGLMLPSAIVFLQLLLNDKELLGERFANRPWNNWVNWTIIAVLFVLSATLAAQILLPGIAPSGN